jgi:hypothetical protein
MIDETMVFSPEDHGVFLSGLCAKNYGRTAEHMNKKEATWKYVRSKREECGSILAQRILYIQSFLTLPILPCFLFICSLVFFATPAPPYSPAVPSHYKNLLLPILSQQPRSIPEWHMLRPYHTACIYLHKILSVIG